MKKEKDQKFKMPYKGTTPYDCIEVAEKYSFLLPAKVYSADGFFLRSFYNALRTRNGFYIDLGCGTGYLTSQLANMLYRGRVVGIEPSRYFYQMAISVRMFRPGIDIKHCKGSEMIDKAYLDKDSVDGITAIQVLLNINDKKEVEETIRISATILKKGGIFFMSSLNPEAIANNVQGKTIKIFTGKNFSLEKVGVRYRSDRLLSNGEWIVQANRHWPRAWLISQFKKNSMYLESELIPVPLQVEIKEHPELDNDYAEYVAYIFRKR